MNDTIQTLLEHRTVRSFAPDPAPAEDVRRAVEAGQRASTSSAVQAYAIIQVTDTAQRRELVELTGGQPQVAEAGAFFVVCADSRRHRLALERRGEPFAARLEGFLVAVIDATLFAQNAVVAFESMGYGVCYIGGLRNRLAEVDALLALPEGVYPLYGLCVGTPASRSSEGPPRPRLPVDAVLLPGAYPGDASMLAHLEGYDEVYREYLRSRGARVPEKTWTDRMAEIFGSPRRPDLGGYYASKGADLT